jgi:hypothetical protein
MPMNRSLIQSIEQSVQTAVAPYLFGNQQSEVEQATEVLGPLLVINNHILGNLHRLLHPTDQGERSPSLLARYILWMQAWPKKLDHYYQEELTFPDRIDRAWLNKEFDQWRNLWAGLQLSDVAWPKIVAGQAHPLLGTLSGQDWILVLKAHSNHRSKQLRN